MVVFHFLPNTCSFAFESRHKLILFMKSTHQCCSLYYYYLSNQLALSLPFFLFFLQSSNSFLKVTSLFFSCFCAPQKSQFNNKKASISTLLASLLVVYWKRKAFLWVEKSSRLIHPSLFNYISAHCFLMNFTIFLKIFNHPPMCLFALFPHYIFSQPLDELMHSPNSIS